MTTRRRQRRERMRENRKRRRFTPHDDWSAREFMSEIGAHIQWDAAPLLLARRHVDYGHVEVGFEFQLKSGERYIFEARPPLFGQRGRASAARFFADCINREITA